MIIRPDDQSYDLKYFIIFTQKIVQKEDFYYIKILFIACNNFFGYNN